MSDNPFGVIGEAMIVSTYAGIFLLIGAVLLVSCFVWRGAFFRLRLILGILILAVAGVIYFGFAGSIGG